MDDGLSGFALNESDIDGGYEEWCAFNYCLATEYYWAIKDEAFDEIGHIDDDTLRLISYWLDYNGSNQDIIDEVLNIPDGRIITYNGRTFAEAVIAEKKGYLALPLIANGNHDQRLYELNNQYLEDLEKGKVMIKV
ncbi:MAG: hypothetical protein IJI22_04630 [Bacilli bacterium]|nr:hypothetical protein [Bacilli bacterium]